MPKKGLQRMPCSNVSHGFHWGYACGTQIVLKPCVATSAGNVTYIWVSKEVVKAHNDGGGGGGGGEGVMPNNVPGQGSFQQQSRQTA